MWAQLSDLIVNILPPPPPAVCCGVQVVDVDPTTGDADEDAEGFPEEYPLEEVEVSEGFWAAIVYPALQLIRCTQDEH
jgi:hypothetical protein